jgi:hypothetical protein
MRGTDERTGTCDDHAQIEQWFVAEMMQILSVLLLYVT